MGPREPARSGGGDLLMWRVTEREQCRSGESGMDNSPRFDPPGLAAAVDFTAYAALEAESLARMAAELGRTEDEARWTAECARLASAIESRLWDDSRGIYRDLAPGGGFAAAESVAGFLPLAAGACSTERAGRLVRTLRDPARFWRALPVPSVAADSAAYSDDMWRGPAWVNMNYLVIEGLRRYGFAGEARDLAARTLSAVLRGYEAEGVLFEFYDAEGTRASGELRRKGSPGRRPANELGVIRDYHWTAALALRLIFEGERPG